MGIDNFDIELLNNPTRTFSPGQTIQGRLHVSVSKKDCKYKGVVMTFQGGSWDHWREFGCKWPRLCQPLKSFGSHESYFNHKIDLIGTSGLVTKNLAVGSYTLPFTFSLPSSIPGSFKGSNGQVSYEISAIIEKPLNEKGILTSTKIPFNIVGAMDLNKDKWMESLQPINVTESRNINFRCYITGPIKFVMTVLRTGYVPGDKISFVLEATNHSKIPIHSTVVHLLQKTTFYHNKGAETKVTRKYLNKVKGPIVWAGETATWEGDTAVIEIPKGLPPTGLPSCNIIHIDYFLLVGLYCAGGIKLEKEIPIIIGTVPLAVASMPGLFGNPIRPAVGGFSSVVPPPALPPGIRMSNFTALA